MAILQTLFRCKRSSESWPKYLFYLVHLWLGILSSLVLTVVCVTGAIYATKPLVEQSVNSNLTQIAVPENETPQMPVNILVEAFELQFDLTPNSITIVPGRATVISHFQRGAKSTTAFYNPYTGNILGESGDKVHGFYDTVMKLHRWLLVRDPGKTIVGASVLIFVFLLMSGLVLWWPKKSQVKKGFVVVLKNQNLYKKLYELHRVFGFYFLLPLLFLSITGLYISYDWVKNGVTLALGGEVEKRQERPGGRSPQKEGADFRKEARQKNDKEQPKVEFPELQKPLASLNEVAPYVGTVQIMMPRQPGGDIRFTKYNTHNWLGASLPDRFSVNEKGEVSSTFFKDLPLHKQMSSINKGLHTSELFSGWVGLVYCIIALFGALLPVTGLWMWIKRATL